MRWSNGPKDREWPISRNAACNDSDHHGRDNARESPDVVIHSKSLPRTSREFHLRDKQEGRSLYSISLLDDYRDLEKTTIFTAVNSWYKFKMCIVIDFSPPAPPPPR